jgi:hypothetical protein
MSDGRILSILNSAAVQSVQQSNSTTSQSNAAPGNLSNLLPGGVLKGEVIGRDSGGNPILRTAQGTDITIRTETFLKYGNQVVIKVDQTGQGARILSIDGQSPQNANPSIPFDPDNVQDQVSTNTTSSRGTTTAPSLAAALSTAAPEDNTDGILIRSVLLSKSPTAQTTLNTLPTQVRIPVESLQPGTQVFVRIASSANNVLPNTISAAVIPQQDVSSSLQKLLSTSPSVQNATAQSSIQNVPANTQPALNTTQTSAATNQGNTVLLSNSQATTTSQPLANSTVQTQPVSSQTITSSNPSPLATTPTQSNPNTVQSPQTNANTSIDQRSSPRLPPVATVSIPTIATNTSASASNITGTFMAFDASGDATFQTPLGILKMPQGVFGNLRLSPGTPLTFDVTGFRLASAGAIKPGALASSTYSNITGMTATLTDIFTIIQSVNPQAATELASRMPQTGANFTGSTLFFIAAMTGGDAGKLLGQRTVSILEQQGRGDLVRKLGADFAVARSGLGETTPSQNWQLFYIPLMHEQEIHPVRMFVKKDRENEEKNKKKKTDTRFIIEVSLSVLGDIQIDGFVKHKEKGLQFDLMLRTLQPLLPEDEKAIFEIYNNAAQIAGFTGSLNISAVKDFPVKPMEDMLGSKEGSITA